MGLRTFKIIDSLIVTRLYVTPFFCVDLASPDYFGCEFFKQLIRSLPHIFAASFFLQRPCNFWVGIRRVVRKKPTSKFTRMCPYLPLRVNLEVGFYRTVRRLGFQTFLNDSLLKMALNIRKLNFKNNVIQRNLIYKYVSTAANRVRQYLYASYKGVGAIWDNSYIAFGSYARFKSQNTEFCNLIVYLIIMMLLYLVLYCSEILLCLIYRSLRNLGKFLLCVWKLCEV